MAVNTEPQPTAFSVPTPFRAEVGIPDFEKIESAKKGLEDAKTIFDKPDEKPLVAQLMMDRFFIDFMPTNQVEEGQRRPNEAKVEALRQTYSLIETDDETKESDFIQYHSLQT